MSSNRTLKAVATGASLSGSDVVVLALHGYGSNERDLVGLLDALALDLPWASLRAPVDTPNGGAAWFPISTPGNPEAAPVLQATEMIWAWVDEHLAEGTCVLPIGFSQGGLMATQLLRTRPERVVAPVVLGGFVLGAVQEGDDELAAGRPRLFWGRGADDAVITADAVVRTTDWVERHVSAATHVYPGLAHGISAQEVADVRTFVRTVVASVG
ncbi:dienelactone hydrolase family protein [Curtobacterium sp. TC1]|uniref:alpha/beta hydrolase n=1 Tax=Curtobacterium sp. TC1 TaxID=2862880 RepID=UPI001C9B7A0E|nr:dienelactone hydrolase family protein [Curtobacterium sp. TC1]QZQ53851.1 dienelactone hydrolase family protein [Curtobacterium sp. TC1]